MDVNNPLEVIWTAASGAAGYRIEVWRYSEVHNLMFNLERKYWNNANSVAFVKTPPDSFLELQHHLEHYYREEHDPFQSDTLFRAILSIDALDEPA